MSDTDETVQGWSNDIESLCLDIQSNTSRLAEIHKQNYLRLINQIKYFKVPVIVISTFNSVFAIGLTAYASQDVVSTVNCIMSMVCSIITSIELYLNLQKRIEVELTSYRAYYMLSIKIANTLHLEREHRQVKDGTSFLLEVENEYRQLFNEANVHQQTLDDNLLKINSPLNLNVSNNPVYSPKGERKQPQCETIDQTL
jgi:hypothetical protein